MPYSAKRLETDSHTALMPRPFATTTASAPRSLKTSFPGCKVNTRFYERKTHTAGICMMRFLRQYISCVPSSGWKRINPTKGKRDIWNGQFRPGSGHRNAEGLHL